MKFSALLLGVAVSAASAVAMAADDGCVAITSVPFTVVQPGCYRLASNLSYDSASGAAITIGADNVELDLAGHALSGHGGSATLAYGIICPQHKNVTVHRGVVEGFLIGIYFADAPPWASQGHLIEEILAVANTYNGIGIMGKNHVVKNTRIVATGGSTASPYPSGVGLGVNGNGIRAIDNDVMGVTSQSGGSGPWGIAVSGTNNLIMFNRVSDAAYGVWINTGAGARRGNTVISATTPYVGGVDLGDNR